MSYLGDSEAHHTDFCRHVTRPFTDPRLITAQVLSFMTLILSFFTESLWPKWLKWVPILLFGLPSFIMIQTAWCCAMNRCGFIAAGVLALVGASIFLFIAIDIMGYFSNCGSYDWAYDDCDEAASWMILSFASGLLWAITGIVVLVFACGKSYQDIADQLRAEGAGGAAVPNTTAVAKCPIAVKRAVPIAAITPMQQAPVAGTSTTTITNMPDGSMEKKTEVINPDGSKTITVLIQKLTEDV
jgi:hypothetical protein